MCAYACEYACACALTLSLLFMISRLYLFYKKKSTNHNSVRVHDGVESMSYGQNCAVFEFDTNRLLDKGISAEKKYIYRKL